MTTTNAPIFTSKTALVTGANSGLGFEAAAQLAKAGYGRVILACRTSEKAEGARVALVERVGADPFEVITVELSSLTSTQAALGELVKRANPIDSLLLNAGMASGVSMDKSIDDIEITFASSRIGHHLLTVGLLEAGLLREQARVVIAGSEAANNDLPSMMDMKVYDFVTGPSTQFGDTLHDTMVAFARGAKPESFRNTRYYATTKVFTSWWAASMARRFGDRATFFAVSPGSNMSTNAARTLVGFKKFLFTKIMPLLGPLLGMDQPVSRGAKRYLDVMHSVGDDYVNGATYTSRAKKLVGPLEMMTHAHLLDVERQDEAWRVLSELTAFRGKKVAQSA
jgi:NAD(P)-dependent dehydrogenase (short-subunit alcohol dehydrogenase family)